MLLFFVIFACPPLSAALAAANFDVLSQNVSEFLSEVSDFSGSSFLKIAKKAFGPVHCTIPVVPMRGQSHLSRQCDTKFNVLKNRMCLI